MISLNLNNNNNNNNNYKTQDSDTDVYTVVHIEDNDTKSISIGLIDAKNQIAATIAANKKFPKSTILKVSVKKNYCDYSKYPDAKFIRGKFHSVKKSSEVN